MQYIYVHAKVFRKFSSLKRATDVGFVWQSLKKWENVYECVQDRFLTQVAKIMLAFKHKQNYLLGLAPRLKGWNMWKLDGKERKDMRRKDSYN